MIKHTITVTVDTLRQARADTIAHVNPENPHNSTRYCLFATAIKAIVPGLTSMGYWSYSIAGHSGEIRPHGVSRAAYVAAIEAFDLGLDRAVETVLPMVLTVTVPE